MTEREAYMKGVSFAVETWENPNATLAELRDGKPQRQFNKGYLDANLRLFSQRSDVDMAIRRGSRQRERVKMTN